MSISKKWTRVSPLSAGKKGALTRATGQYTFDEHIKGKPQKIQDLAIQVQEYVTSLDPAIKEHPKKFYVAYKSSQNIVCMEVKRQKLILYIKLNPTTLKELPPIARNVTQIGHYGTGNLELTIKKVANLETAKHFIETAYRCVGG